MNKLAELAKAEADAAEVENPDSDEAAEAAEKEAAEEAGQGDEPETPETPRDDVDAEKIMGSVATRATNYMKAVYPMVEKLGAGFMPCPLCEFPGLVRPLTEYEVPSDKVAAILGMIGRAPEPDYKPSQAYARCETCDGWGDVLTGAQKDVSRTAMCVTCGGKGYVNQVQPTPILAPIPAPPFPGSGTPYTPLPVGTSDAWNRPAGHPHWGLDPAMVGSPNGQTVG